jgi:hypothetical protein
VLPSPHKMALTADVAAAQQTSVPEVAAGGGDVAVVEVQRPQVYASRRLVGERVKYGLVGKGTCVYGRVGANATSPV